jgi:hypothetical protein
VPFYSGQQGQLFIDGVKAAHVQNWSFQTSQAVLDTTSLEDTDRTITQGVRSTSGSCRLFYYQATAGGGGDVTKLLSKCMKVGTGEGDGTATASSSAKLKLMVADGSTAGRYIEMFCFLTSVSMSMAVGEVLSADVSFEANGAPTGILM